MKTTPNFLNLHSHDFVRIAVATPLVQVADPAFNADQTIALLKEAVERNALVTIFPELGLSAWSCDDLLQQQVLFDACQTALKLVLAASCDLPSIVVLGLPLQIGDLLFNCATILYRGNILGVVPKTYLPNYREFYEGRQFAPRDFALKDDIELCGQSSIPFGNRLLFEIDEQPLLRFYVEISEDLWVPIPPSSVVALAGATLLINLSASNATIGKADYRRQLVCGQSARCLAAYAYSAAGSGESTTDLAWDGHGMIYENGTALAETHRFLDTAQLITADVDLDRLSAERMRQTSVGQSAQRHRDQCTAFRTIRVDAAIDRKSHLPLQRSYDRFPYVPSDPATLDARCREACEIQVQGLVTRMRAAGVEKLVIGVSGGLDSAQALLVCVAAMEMMHRPCSHVIACMLPGFATSERTASLARQLIGTLGCQVNEIDIRPACMQMLKDIDHPFPGGKRSTM
ncbi:NAD(+) synthase [Paraburkholderia sp. RL17-373-BIF-A]|uniref:NAD(+) synthase n=1 Tax=Paraburkholderia sp. RL17-373-BIF-A TaxID=3031629 RepID=UPI0038BA8E62